MAADNMTLGMATLLRKKVLEEQKLTRCQKVDIPPFTLAAFAAWNSLAGLPISFLQGNFPMMCAWARQMVEEVTSLIGTVALFDQRTLRKKITIEAKVLFDRARDAVMAELDGFAVHMESKLDRLTPYMKDLMERQLNGVAELFQELGGELKDPSLFHVANMAAEASVRCLMRPPDRTGWLAKKKDT